KYGDRYDANAKIRELTDQRDYVKDKVNWTRRAIEKWDEYRSGIADALAGKARTYFILGEEAMASASRKDRASQHFLAARPWLEAALKFNPDHSEARKMLATVDANASAAEAANKEAIAKAVWPNDVRDRKSTRLNSSHVKISYAVFCLKKKKSTERTSKKSRQRTTL